VSIGNRLYRSLLLATTVLAVSAASVGATGRAPGGAPGRPPARDAHALWYRLELAVSGQYWRDIVWHDSRPAASTVSSSYHDTRSSKWSATSAGAFILNRHGPQVTFYANLIGKVESASRAATLTTVSGETSAVPNETCTMTVAGRLSTPVGLTGFVRQYGQPNQLGFLLSPFPRTGHYMERTDYCHGQTFVDSCPDGSLDCETIYLGGGQAFDPTVNRNSRARQLAFKLPSRAHFGHSFSIRRTLAGNLSLDLGPDQVGTDVSRSQVSYALNFTVCSRHGRDVQNC
jgi:hypothetical protein